MISKVAKKLLDETPDETKIFVEKYADIVVRINQLLKEKGYSQKKLAERLDKRPSEINKWLKGEHNLTLRTIAKLEAELGESIINVPQKHYFKGSKGSSLSMTVHKNDYRKRNYHFVDAEAKNVSKKQNRVVA